MLNKMSYTDLRAEIHCILYDFIEREFECAKEDEFDFEFMEAQTDAILRLIRQQGGEV